MKSLVKIYKNLPLEIGKTYRLKMQVEEYFTITDIKYKTFTLDDGTKEERVIRVHGIYKNCEHLGICSLDQDRFVHETVFDKEIECCSKCGEKL